MKVQHTLVIFYKGVQTPLKMFNYLTTSEHQAQQECTECNHCVHLSILHIQMRVKSRSNHTHSWKCCIHSSYFTKVCKHNRNVQYFENVRAPSAAFCTFRWECTECNHCVHLSILHIQMSVKSRSNHTHSWKCSIHSSYFTKVCKHH